MDIFIIHSGADKQIVEKYLDEAKKKAHKLNPLVLENGGALWKIDARKKIKKAQMVVFFVGEKSHESPYIGWELTQAIKYEKPVYTVKLKENFLCHKATIKVNKFSGEEYPYDREVNIDELAEVINNYEYGAYHIFNQQDGEIDKNALMEQYKAFLQTSEDLVLRRQNVNSFYISISSALIALFSALFAFEIKSEYRMVVGILFSIVGIVLSISWIRMLAAYGNLNGSKLKIISGIEKHLPASLYDAEWEALSDKLNKKKYVSFTDSEKLVPKIFMVIYVLIFIALAIALGLKLLPYLAIL